MDKKFKEWLESNSTHPFVLTKKGLCTTLIKVPKSQAFLYLFYQEFNTEASPLGDEKFEFCGVYCLKDGYLYCASGQLLQSMEDDEEITSRTELKLKEQLMRKVREKVETAVGNNRNNLRVTDISNSPLQRELNILRGGSAAEEARRRYLRGENLDSMAFSCSYRRYEWTKEQILFYILNPEEFIDNEFNSYMDSHQDNMLYEFLKNDMLLKEYTALTSDPANPVHIIRRIMMAVNASNARTVKVTILKNGKQFEFKVDADALRRDEPCGYATWHIAAPDRRLYEAEFGSRSYKPEEILRITYGRQTLYEAETN